jgi:hypothetical protein
MLSRLGLSLVPELLRWWCHYIFIQSANQFSHVSALGLNTHLDPVAGVRVKTLIVCVKETITGAFEAVIVDTTVTKVTLPEEELIVSVEYERVGGTAVNELMSDGNDKVVVIAPVKYEVVGGTAVNEMMSDGNE